MNASYIGRLGPLFSPTSATQAGSRRASGYKGRGKPSFQLIPFSAFWLRSSVVSVLISLISDTWVIDPL
ncbi:hypothetical protein MUK42_37027 [Musa troglodytarum]|uniref:Uncharacterized protein n=2 Tax=Musa troglodytarum TaxID=320322 RepID=A0A9E7K0B7_9LILI|nr:hypothetical protein MUK42_37027 [Musa troglodytarum]